MWGAPRNFPRAILHIDGDSFFASCEVAKDPRLRGKAVITGRERGIVSACTYEAKARGIKRGMRLFEVRKLCPDAVILPSDYETYSLFSERMYRIVRRYTPDVEEYSIDECFADLTPTLKNGMASHQQNSDCNCDRNFLRRAKKMTATQEDAIFSTGQAGMLAQCIQQTLERELGMTFSIGLSATKTLAKVGSKWNKPHGLTIIPLSEAPRFLAAISVGEIWGIGPNTAAYLNKYGIRTALDLAQASKAWVRGRLSKPYIDTWYELNGVVKNELDTTGRETYQSISKTKTFTPPSSDTAFIYSQLSKNVENACIKARRWKLATPEIFFFLKTQEFKYHGCEIKLPYPTATPQDILGEIAKYYSRIFQKGVQYRATGIALLKLAAHASAQLDLFGAVRKSEGLQQIFESVDAISEKYGKHAVFLGSSFSAIGGSLPGQAGASGGAAFNDRDEPPARHQNLFKGETSRRRLAIPFLGEVH